MGLLYNHIEEQPLIEIRGTTIPIKGIRTRIPDIKGIKNKGGATNTAQFHSH